MDMQEKVISEQSEKIKNLEIEILKLKETCSFRLRERDDIKIKYIVVSETLADLLDKLVNK